MAGLSGKSVAKTIAPSGRTGSVRMRHSTIRRPVEMLCEEGLHSAMDSERIDRQLQVLSNLDVVTSTIGRDCDWPRPVPAVSVVDSALPAPEGAWVSLLEAARYQRPARLMYCLIVKQWLDRIGAALLILLFAPLLMLAALLVRLDTHGAVIYRQRRVGRYGRPFTMYKFRTMIPDRRQGNGPYAGPERRKAHKTAFDPRLTRTGRFLRRTSIDELPQLFNVLRGEMSLVGPRPELVDIVRSYEPWQHQRHLVLPGITGWWQTHGRSDLVMHEHTELDIYYVQNISFVLDVCILFRTLRTLVVRAGAF